MRFPIARVPSQVLLFLFIAVLSIFTRFSQLGAYPAGLHNDEASFLVNTIAFLTNGRDEDGRSWPVFLNSYIDPKPALYSYLQMPFVATGGSTTAMSRMPAAHFGTGSILLFWLLLSRVGATKRVSFFATLLLSASPWHIIVTRGTQEVIASFFWTLLSVVLLTYVSENWDKQKPKLVGALFAGFSFSSLLAVYFYHSTKIVLPLVLFGYFLFRTRKKVLSFLEPLTIATVIGLTLIITVLFSGTLDRYKQINIFSTSDTQLILEEQIRVASGHQSPFLIRVFHNKVINYSRSLLNTYSQHFTTEFLFISGGAPSRYAIPEHGLLYLTDFILLCCGVLSIFFSKTAKLRSLHFFFGWWLLVSPLPAALTTQEVPSSIRTFAMIVPLYYFMGSGFAWLLEGAQRALGLLRSHIHIQKMQWTQLSSILFLTGFLVFCSAYAYFIGYFANQYTVQAPYYQPWDRNEADAELARLLTKYKDTIKGQIWISNFEGQPYVYLVLNGLISIEELQQSYPRRLKPPYEFGTFLFSERDCPGKHYNNYALYAVKHDCIIPKEAKIIDQASFRDKSRGYFFVENYQPENDQGDIPVRDVNSLDPESAVQ